MDEQALQDEYDAINSRILTERRDRFAAAALTGLLTNAHHIGFSPTMWAKDAVEQADALIAELDK